MQIKSSLPASLFPGTGQALVTNYLLRMQSFYSRLLIAQPAQWHMFVVTINAHNPPTSCHDDVNPKMTDLKNPLCIN